MFTNFITFHEMKRILQLFAEKLLWKANSIINQTIFSQIVALISHQMWSDKDSARRFKKSESNHPQSKPNRNLLLA